MNNVLTFLVITATYFANQPLQLLAQQAAPTNAGRSQLPVLNQKPIGTLELVAELDVNPGNVAVSKEGRIFASIHPLRPCDVQLVEITGKTTYVPFPSERMQSNAERPSNKTFDAPLGVLFDEENRLWLVDVGLRIGRTRVFAYDINTKSELFRFEIPSELAPKTSFVQDLVVDEANGFVYLADAMNAGIIAIDIEKNSFMRIVHLPSMQSEDIDMVIDGKVQFFDGEKLRIALDPITISDDRETIFFGAMNGTKWYRLPTAGIRSKVSHDEIVKHIAVVGEKPISDGAATDADSNHYFTNVQNHSIDLLSNAGKLSKLVKHPKLDWPDSVRIHGDWLYVATNQIHKSPIFTGGKDLKKTPFQIFRVKFR